MESRFGAVIPDDHFPEVLNLRSRRPRIKDEKINLRIESRFGTSIRQCSFDPVPVLDLVLREDQPWSPLVPEEVSLCWGMSLLSFLVLILIGAVVAVAYHNVIRYRFLEGNDALFGKLIVGWLGAWLGSPVFGHWLWKIENVYLVPAILGAAATIHLTVLTGKALAKLASMQPAATVEKKEEIRPSKPAVAA